MVPDDQVRRRGACSHLGELDMFLEDCVVVNADGQQTAGEERPALLCERDAQVVPGP